MYRRGRKPGATLRQDIPLIVPPVYLSATPGLSQMFVSIRPGRGSFIQLGTRCVGDNVVEINVTSDACRGANVSGLADPLAIPPSLPPLSLSLLSSSPSRRSAGVSVPPRAPSESSFSRKFLSSPLLSLSLSLSLSLLLAIAWLSNISTSNIARGT